MNFEEFLKPEKDMSSPEVIEEINENTDDIEDFEEVDFSDDLDVQKAVVESLAAEKVEQLEHIVELRKLNNALRSENSELKQQIESLRERLSQIGDKLALNEQSNLSNQVTLLERNIDVDERFTGEIRDHVLEVISDARNEAEKTGRLRRAQILEAVLLANEPNGELAKRRNKLEKLFADNQYVVNGQVINELDKFDISYKCGENYFLPSEIINRTY